MGSLLPCGGQSGAHRVLLGWFGLKEQRRRIDVPTLLLKSHRYTVFTVHQDSGISFSICLCIYLYIGHCLITYNCSYISRLYNFIILHQCTIYHSKYSTTKQLLIDCEYNNLSVVEGSSHQQVLNQGSVSTYSRSEPKHVNNKILQHKLYQQIV